MQKLIILLLCFKCFNIYCIKPTKEYLQLPSDYGLPYIDTFLITKDSSKINVWIIKQDSAKGTYLLAYGDAGNKSNLLYQAYYLYHQGYTIVMFDYRGFGTSSNFTHNDKYLYHSEYFIDFETVYQFCKYKTKKLRIYALSMGTIFASRIQSDSNDVHIYDSPVLNLKYAIKALKKHKKIILITPKISSIIVPKNTILIYGTKDFLVKEKDIINFTKNGNCITYKYNFGHLQAMNSLGSKYFELLNIL